MQILSKKNEALAKKIRKFVAHSEHLEKKCRILKEENKEISKLRKELEKMNLELKRVNVEFQEAQLKSAEMKDVDKTLKQKVEVHSKLEEEYKVLKEKYAKQKGVNASLRQSSEELEYEKNRQISYLEGENLKYLRELKESNKEIQSLKAQRNFISSEVHDEPTEDLGSIISMKLNGDKTSPEDSNKENCSVQVPSTLSQKRPTVSRVGLGAGVNNKIDDDPGECKQS